MAPVGVPRKSFALLGVRGWLTDEDAEKSINPTRAVEGYAHISLLQVGEGGAKRRMRMLRRDYSIIPLPTVILERSEGSESADRATHILAFSK